MALNEFGLPFHVAAKRAAIRKGIGEETFSCFLHGFRLQISRDDLVVFAKDGARLQGMPYELIKRSIEGIDYKTDEQLYEHLVSQITFEAVAPAQAELPKASRRWWKLW